MDFNNTANAYARGFDSDVWRPIGGLAGGLLDTTGTKSLFGDHAAAQGMEMTFAGDRLVDYFNTANAKANLEAYEEMASNRSGNGGGGGIFGQLAGTAGAAIGTAIGGPVGGVIGGGLGNIVGGLFG